MATIIKPDQLSQEEDSCLLVKGAFHSWPIYEHSSTVAMFSLYCVDEEPHLISAIFHLFIRCEDVNGGTVGEEGWGGGSSGGRKNSDIRGCSRLPPPYVPIG